MEKDGRHLCFQIGAERFAVALADVREVIGPLNIVPVPQAEPSLLGIINLRGRVLSVFDLGVRMKIRAKFQSHPETAILILEKDDLRVGFVVDSVESVANWEGPELEDPDESLGKNRNFISKIAKEKDKLCFVLSVEELIGRSNVKKAAA